MFVNREARAVYPRDQPLGVTEILVLELEVSYSAPFQARAQPDTNIHNKALIETVEVYQSGSLILINAN